MKKVDLNISNYTKCLCPVCPVQAMSICDPKKDSEWLQERKTVGDILEEYPEHPEAYETDFDALEKSDIGRRNGFRRPSREETRELYCAIGPSNCLALNKKELCQCPDCAVWQSYGLDTVYYCFGKALEK